MRITKRNLQASTTTSVVFLVMVIIQGSAVPKLWADASNSFAKIPFADAEIKIEFNSTDEDVGVQVSLDGEPWRRVTIVSPNGRTILEITGSDNLRKQGLTELFFESSEPSLDEVPLSEFLARFPEGEYKFFGITTEGDRLEGRDTLTHAIPDGPSIVSPSKNGVVLDPTKTFIRWDPVTAPAGIQIVGYEVTVSGAKISREFSVLLPPTSTSVKVPREILEPGRRYDFEVLSIEVSGNQTITSGFFRTAR